MFSTKKKSCVDHSKYIIKIGYFNIDTCSKKESFFLSCQPTFVEILPTDIVCKLVCCGRLAVF